LRLTPLLGPGGFLANGEDVALIDVEAIDAQGERCPTFQERVDFDPHGPAVWRGGYNSGKAHSINNLFLDLECGVNRVALRSTRTPGVISLTAHSEGLRPATLTLTSSSVTVTHGFAATLPALPALPALPGTKSEDLLILAESQPRPQPSAGRFLKAFSYSGPSSFVSVQRGAQDGQKVYADRDYVFSGLPVALSGSDWVQAACADKAYSAEDLMEFGVGVGGIMYVAHDNRLPRPEWLQRQFKPTSLEFTVNGKSMSVFERRVREGESLTLGSNTSDLRLKSSNMYVVFISESGSPGRSHQAQAHAAENAGTAPVHGVPVP
jgi:beta-galactosidase